MEKNSSVNLPPAALCRAMTQNVPVQTCWGVTAPIVVRSLLFLQRKALWVCCCLMKLAQELSVWWAIELHWPAQAWLTLPVNGIPSDSPTVLHPNLQNLFSHSPLCLIESKVFPWELSLFSTSRSKFPRVQLLAGYDWVQQLKVLILEVRPWKAIHIFRWYLCFSAFIDLVFPLFMLHDNKWLHCSGQRWRLCGPYSWPWGRWGPGGSWGDLGQPGGHYRRRKTSNELEGLCDLGALQVGDGL